MKVNFSMKPLIMTDAFGGIDAARNLVAKHFNSAKAAFIDEHVLKYLTSIKAYFGDCARANICVGRL